MFLENQNNHESNAFIERALSVGLQRSSKNEQEDESTIVKLDEFQLGKAEELCDFLGCSLENLMNLAINCAISFAKVKGVDINQLEGYPKELGLRSLKAELSTKTYIKLEESGMNEKVAECAVLGIELFHKNFIGNTRLKSQNKN